jgi:hypothetical protein
MVVWVVGWEVGWKVCEDDGERIEEGDVVRLRM